MRSELSSELEMEDSNDAEEKEATVVLLEALNASIDALGEDRASPNPNHDSSCDGSNDDDVGLRGHTQLSLARRLKTIVDTLGAEMEMVKVVLAETLVQHSDDYDGVQLLRKNASALARQIAGEYGACHVSLAELTACAAAREITDDSKAQMVSNLEALVGSLQERNAAIEQQVHDKTRHAKQISADAEDLREENMILEDQVAKTDEIQSRLLDAVEDEKLKEAELAQDLSLAKKRLAIAETVAEDAGTRREAALARVSQLNTELQLERVHVQTEHSELVALQARAECVMLDQTKEAESLAEKAAALQAQLSSTVLVLDTERTHAKDEHARVVDMQGKLEDARTQQAAEALRLSTEKQQTQERLNTLQGEMTELRATLDDVMSRNVITMAKMQAEEEGLQAARAELVLGRLHDKELAIALAEETKNLHVARAQAVEAANRRASAITRVDLLRVKLDDKQTRLNAELSTVCLGAHCNTSLLFLVTTASVFAHTYSHH